ncbi:hypothetical protein EG327_007576 [Venturia inaequalis]|uniref:Uncharacterized protein n=1 Tax=Venturia inaequalis TaxID=5025 RepID=A0A8H3UYA4_VENIN|nr:hypothetical protein EG327_007576 [Venturia inaequalis]
MASALEIASTMEFENRELQPEARILACLETLPKVHNEEEFDDYFTETFNAACHNQGLVDEEHAQIAEAWLSKVKISHDSNEDAEDADEKVLRAFPLLRDVESLPLLEDFCNDDKKNWEMVQWIMQPMVKWPSVEDDLEAYFKCIMSVAFNSPRIAHIDAATRLGFGVLASPSSFTEAEILALPSSKPEVWEKLKGILEHTKVVEA